LGKAGCGALQENVGDGDCPGTGRQLVVLIARDDRHLPGAATHGEINETVARDDRHLPVATIHGEINETVARDDRYAPGAATHGEIIETRAQDDCYLPVAVLNVQLKRQGREMTVRSPELNCAVS
jgi:hypothetical protein